MRSHKIKDTVDSIRVINWELSIPANIEAQEAFNIFFGELNNSLNFCQTLKKQQLQRTQSNLYRDHKRYKAAQDYIQ